MPRFEGVFDKLVQLVEVDIGKKLAGEVANGQAAACRRIAQTLVRGHLGCRSGVGAPLLHWLVQQAAGCGVARRPRSTGRVFGNAVLELGIQGGPVDAIEKVVHIQLQKPAPPVALAHKGVQSVHCRVAALVRAVGVAVVNEQGFIQPL